MDSLELRMVSKRIRNRCTSNSMWLSGRLMANEVLKTPLNILLIVTYDLLRDFLHSNTASG